MRFHISRILAAAFVFGVIVSTRAPAQQHRATRLGDPETRFAPPLTKPEQLRTLLLDEKWRADVASILRQAGWKGELEDLRRAAATSHIVELKLPKGTRLPFMSTRRQGKPVALMDVLWAGEQPIEAYAFEFSSQGRRYRLVTPKPCSNFLVVDLGPEPRPSLQLVKSAPAEASVCDPFEVRLTIRNSGNAAATQVRVTDMLPAGLKTVDQQASVAFDAGTLSAGASREFRFNVRATAPGIYENQARAMSAERWGAEASARTRVRAPVLELDCRAPADANLARPAEVCLTVRNRGDAPEPHLTLTLPIPAGATVGGVTEGGVVTADRVVWQWPNLAAAGSRKACATFTVRQPVVLSFAPSAQGVCSQPVESPCVTRVSGIPAILLEVVDAADPTVVGNEITYEIKVLNQGSATLTNIKLSCALPEIQEFISGSGVTAVQGQGRQAMTEPLPALGPKAEGLWRVVVKAVAPGDARFSVELSSDQHPRAVQEFEASTQY